MTKSAFHEFVNQCIARDTAAGGLSLEDLYGLYLSWCWLLGSRSVSGRTFRAGLRAAHIDPGGHIRVSPPAMTPGAACESVEHRGIPSLRAGSNHIRLTPPAARVDPQPSDDIDAVPTADT